jgi:2-methylcitrate dehydratase PrpD
MRSRNMTSARELEELLGFAANLRWDAVPGPVRRTALVAVADTVGVMCGGREVGATVVARQYLRRHELRQGESLAEGLSPASSAWFLGMAGHVLDFDDTHWPTILHASNPIVAALLASGAVTGGTAFAEAYLAGFEVGARVARSMPRGHYDRGWHVTGTVGGIGAAVAVTRLLGGGARDLRLAVSAAADQATGHRQHFGSMAKSLNAGNAARTGVLSALLVREGFLPDAEGLEGRRGMWAVMSDGPDAAVLSEGLGTDWEMNANGLKPYPCGVVSHPAIEAAEEVRHQIPEGGKISSVELTVHPLVVELTNKDVTADFDVKFSVRTLVAMGLLDRARTVANFGASGLEGKEDLDLLADVVKVVEDPLCRQEEARITVVLADGVRIGHQVTEALGSPGRPVPTDQARQKFCSLWDGEAEEETFDQLLGLDELNDAGPFAEQLRATIFKSSRPTSIDCADLDGR